MKSHILSIAILLFSALSLNASVLVTNGLTHRHDLQGVTDETGYIVLKNIGDVPERILVYFKDLEVGCEEPTKYADPGTSERSNYQWIKVGIEERILQPGEEFPMRYQISVPQKKQIGSFWSLIMIEVKKPIDTTQLDYGVRVSSNIRYAVQIITDFPTEVATNVEFNAVDLKKDQVMGKVVSVTLENFGLLVLVPEVKIEVYDNNGELILQKTADTKKLYPGQCREFQVPIEGLPVGKYQGVLVADCGEADLFGMTLNLEVDD